MRVAGRRRSLSRANPPARPTPRPPTHACVLLGARHGNDDRGAATASQAAAPEGEAIEVQIDDGRRVEGEELAQEEPADDGDAERAAELGAGAGAEGEGQR